MDDIAKNLAANGPYDGLPGGECPGSMEIPHGFPPEWADGDG